MTNILIGITGGIAAYKIPLLVRILKKSGFNVKCVLTENAKKYVSEVVLDALSDNENIISSFEHIELAKWADILIVAPSSANFIAKLAHGIADDLLSTICIATTAPVLVAPAMNKDMLNNVAVLKNLETLTKNNITILSTAIGEQACGDYGDGRMLEPEQILFQIKSHLTEKIFAGKKILICSGATKEYLDPIRYLSNNSSGKTGFYLAKNAIKMGAVVEFVSAKSEYLEKLVFLTNNEVNITKIVSADDMEREVQRLLGDFDIIINCAAVSDYKSSHISSKKIKKDYENVDIQFNFKRTSDIFDCVKKNKHSTLKVIGFAAETNDLIENARKKLIKKELDMIIANDCSNGKAFDLDYNEYEIILKNESHHKTLNYDTKDNGAKKILNMISKI
ncbi:MAG: phosphopantothenoylcysteine decarboxylase/phosphopantothenate--cysteine ligase [Candidatus Midichloriaceae bacterium]|jgi:phosphopantothenoylcysteine decarboxylase/phosphopantothenate--cysteine ligase